MERITVNQSDPRLQVGLTEEHKEYIKNVADNRGITMAALCRKWLAAGERAEAAVIPDFDDPDSTHSTVQDPVEQLFLDELPDSAEEAVSVDEIREKMKDRIDGDVMKLYRSSDNIIVTEGGDIYYADE
jgi:hypothetical protein